jgi:hypothetical protein
MPALPRRIEDWLDLAVLSIILVGGGILAALASTIGAGQ